MQTVLFLLSLCVIAACATPGQRSIQPASSASARESAVRVVQQQVHAYNRRDLESFLTLFATDAKLYQFPDTLLFDGKDALRTAYGKLFSEATNLRADVTNRIVQGRFVIDREITTGMPGKGPVIGSVIYEVVDGRVSRVWFVD